MGLRWSCTGAYFFTLEPGTVPSAYPIVGNPPFIRYQGFYCITWWRVLELAPPRVGGETDPPHLRLGTVPAPHAIQFLRPGGDLATVPGGRDRPDPLRR